MVIPHSDAPLSLTLYNHSRPMPFGAEVHDPVPGQIPPSGRAEPFSRNRSSPHHTLPQHVIPGRNQWYST